MLASTGAQGLPRRDRRTARPSTTQHFLVLHTWLPFCHGRSTKERTLVKMGMCGLVTIGWWFGVGASGVRISSIDSSWLYAPNVSRIPLSTKFEHYIQFLSLNSSFPVNSLEVGHLSLSLQSREYSFHPFIPELCIELESCASWF